MRLRGLAVIAGILLGAVPCAAKPHQDPAASGFAGRVEVRLVEIDAWATARDGRPVTDLRQDELRLTEDGKPVDIFYFARPTAEGGGAGPSEETIEGTPRTTTLAIYFDDAHLEPAHRAHVAAAIEKALATQLPAATGVMVVRYDRAVRVVLPRTADRAAVLAALDAMASPATAAIEASGDEQKTLEAIRERQRAAVEHQRSPTISGSGLSSPDPRRSGLDASSGADVPCPTELLHLADGLAERVAASSDGTLDALSELASALGDQPGQKVLLFVSDGLPTRPGGVAYDYVRALCDGSGARAGLQYAVEVLGTGADAHQPGQLSASMLALAGEGHGVGDRLQRTIAQANTSGVVVWGFGARGLTTGGTDASVDVRTDVEGSRQRREGELQDALAALAEDTGGRTILETNDFASAMDELGEDLRSSYALAFQSPRAGDDEIHRIGLTTTRPGVRLRFRRSWRDTSVGDDLVAAIDGAMRYGIDKPGLGAQAVLMRRPGEGGGLVLRLAIPEKSLVALPADDHQLHAQLRVALALRGNGAAPSAVRSMVMPLTLSASPAKGEPHVLVRDIGLPPLELPALVVVGLRDELVGTTAVLRLEVPVSPAARQPGG